VIEFNARFGDPETESYMRILKTDLVDILLACTDGKLNEQKIEWENFSVCTVMCASKGYPGSYEKGKIISGLENLEKNIVVFHAGTKEVDGKNKSSLFINQNGASIKHAFTRENPNGMPDMEQVTVKGQQVWDDTKRIEFLYNMVATTIIPTASASPRFA
jgi:phosphoribosylamine-glycine ligase